MVRRFVAGSRRAWGMAAGAGLVGWAALRVARRIDLKGRVVMVTGAGHGLGFAIARAFAARGCVLALCGPDGDEGATAAADLRAEGAVVHARACDVTDPKDVGAFVARVVAKFGAVDVLVNNAGHGTVAPVAALEPEDLAMALRDVFWAQFHPTMAVLPHMRARRFGRIVNVTSLAGKIPVPHQAALVAGAFAATGWSEALAVELAKDGIRVSTVTPPPARDGGALDAAYRGRAEDEFLWLARAASSPLSAASVASIARVVVDAARHGDAERSVVPLAWLAARLQGVAPNLTSHVLAWVDKSLPAPGHPVRTSPRRRGDEVILDSLDARVQLAGAITQEDAARYRPHPP